MFTQKKMNLFDAAAELKSRPLATEFLTPAKTGFICPHCGNGSGDSGTGIKINADNCSAFCGKCQRAITNIDVFAGYLGIGTTGKDFAAAVKAGCEYFGITFENINSGTSYPARRPICEPANLTPAPRQKSAEELEQEKLYLELTTKDLAQPDNLEKLPAEERRGLTIETLRYWKCICAEKWIHPLLLAEYKLGKREREKLPFPSRRILIPTENGTHYNAILLKQDRAKMDKTYWKQHAGQMATFGLTQIVGKSDPTEIIYAMEGEIDALSAWQSYNAAKSISADLPNCAFVAVLGAARKAWTDEVVARCEELQIKPVIVVYFDNDNTGRAEAEKAVAKLLRRGFPAVTRFLERKEGDLNTEEKSGKFDPNDYLIKYGESALADELIKTNKEILDNRADLENQVAVAQEQARQETAEKEAKQRQQRAAAIEKKLWFLDGVKNKEGEDLKEKFIELSLQPETFNRNVQMIKILRDTLTRNTNLLGQPTTVKHNYSNFARVFELDPNLQDLLGYNQFTGKITFGRRENCEWRHGENVRFSDWENYDDSALRLYLRKNYSDLHNTELLQDFIITTARRNSFHPIRNFFENLPAWDGTERAAKIFIDFLKVPDTEFARVVTMKWLLAAVARAYFPACNFQSAIVLQGQQNIGKSYLLEKLGGAFYGALIDDVDDAHAVDAIRNVWICELKEFSAARKAEINSLKSFIERPADTYRAAYERRAETFKRQCVFAISVNDKQFLRDVTGNRRFWILESPLKKFGYVEGLSPEYIQQVWAEVFYQFSELTRDGFNDKILEIPYTLKMEGETIAQNFTANDGLVEEIGAFLDIPILPPPLWKVLTVPERRKFFAEKSITLEQSDWTARKKIVLRSDEERIAFDKALGDNTFVRNFSKKFGDTITAFAQVYGSYCRNLTCAAEIYNEFCGSGDKRKNIYRIVEALGSVEDWQLLAGKRDKNFHGYGDQKKIFGRIAPLEVSVIPADTAEIVEDGDDVDVPF